MIFLCAAAMFFCCWLSAVFFSQLRNLPPCHWSRCVFLVCVPADTHVTGQSLAPGYGLIDVGGAAGGRWGHRRLSPGSGRGRGGSPCPLQTCTVGEEVRVHAQLRFSVLSMMAVGARVRNTVQCEMVPRTCVFSCCVECSGGC